VVYKVDTENYSGSLEDLVEKTVAGTLDIFDICLHELISSYLDRLSLADRAIDLEEASEFLMLVSLLIELKSSKLLPEPEPVDMEDELEDLSERDLLISRLLRCRTYAAAGRQFAQMISEASLSLPHLGNISEAIPDFKLNLLETVTCDSLRKAMCSLLDKHVPQHVDMSHVGVDSVRVSDAIAILMNTLPNASKISFSRLVYQMDDRLAIIAHFLALLELAKVGAVILEQRSYSDELYVTWIGIPDDTQLLDAVFLGSQWEGAGETR
jgi:Uncharacterized conserved protein, COG1354